MLKEIFPDLQKLDTKVINAFSNRLNVHKMGSISTKGLTEYINKLWKN
jgi:hypothetical protein